MRSIICFFLFLFSITLVSGQLPDEPTFTLYLIGDAGADDTTGPTLQVLEKLLKVNANSAVVFLGDNCYRRAMYGLLPINVKGYDGSKITKKRVMSQLNILKEYKGSAFFVPGNHDWWNLTNFRRGKKALLKEETFIENTLKNYKGLKNNGSTFLPDTGSPGPVIREFNNDRTRIIFIDTYRLILEEGEKRQNVQYLNTFYGNLKKALKGGLAKKQKIIVVGHHPIHAKGSHSVPLTAWQTVFRRFADSNTNYPPYNRMAKRLDSLLIEESRPDVFYVSGHEHSLEYFNNDSLQYIVSGAGSKVDHVDYKETVKSNEYFIWNEEGFFEIQFYGRFERVILHHRKNDELEMKSHCLIGCDVK